MRDKNGRFIKGNGVGVRTGIYRDCDYCHKNYYVIKSRIGLSYFCGNKCSNHKGLRKNTGRTLIKKGQYSGENSFNWKGDKASYSALHYWVYRKLGKPSKCEHCGVTESKKFVWANISREYKRDITDWVRLCTPCHCKYDDIGNKVWAIRRLNNG